MLEGLYPVSRPDLYVRTTACVTAQSNRNRSRQVFWLSRLRGGLPLPLKRKSGTQRPQRLPPKMDSGGRGYSGGTAPDSHGIPY
jgi:hypothetical protein